MKKSFEYIIKISETEFYDKLKKHTAFNCSSSSYDYFLLGTQIGRAHV